MKVTLYLRREVLRMHVHPDADFTNYHTVLAHAAQGLAPHLPDRVSAVLVLEQGLFGGASCWIPRWVVSWLWVSRERL